MFVTKLSAAVLAAALTTAPFASFAQTPSLATQTVDDLNKIWGKHPGYRANHAKGVVAMGEFVPTSDAAKLSKASIFAGPAVPVTVRFSDSGGLPTLPDGAPQANPHGMSIKFQKPGGGTVDLVLNSLGFFPVANGEDFLELLQASIDSPPGGPAPSKLDQFVAAHPAVPKALATAATPSSFARETYNGVDAFILVDAAGKRQPFRFKIEPVAGTEHLAAADAAKLPADYLMDELPKRLQQGPVVFRVEAQLAQPGDPTKDPTQPWPADRPLAQLGTLTLTKAADDSEAAQKQLRYLPSNLEPGIEVSDDPLIDARVRAYVISFGRRAAP